MTRHALALGLVLALALAGCAAEEGAPEPMPSTSPTASDTATTTAAGTTTTTSSSSSTSTAPRPAQTFEVNIQGNSFVDGTKTIQKGDAVRWTQKDSNTHTVTANDGSFDSGNMIPVGPTSTFSHTFSTVGEFPYYCEVHTSMTAKITVVETLPA